MNSREISNPEIPRPLPSPGRTYVPWALMKPAWSADHPKRKDNWDPVRDAMTWLEMMSIEEAMELYEKWIRGDERTVHPTLWRQLCAWLKRLEYGTCHHGVNTWLKACHTCTRQHHEALQYVTSLKQEVIAYYNSEKLNLLWPLHEEVLFLFYRWKIYQQLFGSGAENLDLLNRSGSNVFALLQVLTEENMFLTLSRLTDPAQNKEHYNLNLTYLLEKLGPTLTSKLRKNLWERLDSLKKETRTIRIHRNKRIAHLDLSHAQKVERLPSVGQSDLANSMELLESIMRDIHRAISNADTKYKDPAIAYGCDGKYLLGVLRAHQQGV
jgi:hypothetical protein